MYVKSAHPGRFPTLQLSSLARASASRAQGWEGMVGREFRSRAIGAARTVRAGNHALPPPGSPKALANNLAVGLDVLCVGHHALEHPVELGVVGFER